MQRMAQMNPRFPRRSEAFELSREGQGKDKLIAPQYLANLAKP